MTPQTAENSTLSAPSGAALNLRGSIGDARELLTLLRDIAETARDVAPLLSLFRPEPTPPPMPTAPAGAAPSPSRFEYPERVQSANGFDPATNLPISDTNGSHPDLVLQAMEVRR